MIPERVSSSADPGPSQATGISAPSSAGSVHQQAQAGLNAKSDSNRIRIKIRVPALKMPRDDGKKKSIQEIDEFRYVSKGDVPKRCKRTGGAVGGSQKFTKAAKHKKNGDLKGDGKRIREIDELIYVVGKDGVRKGKLKPKSGLLECLNLLKDLFGAMGRDCEEDVDFVDRTNGRDQHSVFPRSSIFPRPRWWPPESDSDGGSE